MPLKIFLFSALLILTACGRENSASQNISTTQEMPNQGNFTLNFSPPHATLEFTNGDLGNIVYVRADYVGEPPNDEDVFVLVTHDEYIHTVGTFIEKDHTLLSIIAADNLDTGSYKGSILIDVCRDQFCQEKFGPTNELTYSIEVYRDETLYQLKSINGDILEPANPKGFSLVVDPSQARERFVLEILPERGATSVNLDDDFVTRYNVEKIDDWSYALETPAHSVGTSSITYYLTSFGHDFTGIAGLRVSEVLPSETSIKQLNAPTIAYATPQSSSGTLFSGEYIIPTCNTNPTAAVTYSSTASNWLQFDDLNNYDECFSAVSYDATNINYGFHNAIISSPSGLQQSITTFVNLAYGEEIIGGRTVGFSIQSDGIIDNNINGFGGEIDSPPSTFSLNFPTPWVIGATDLGSYNDQSTTLIQPLFDLNQLGQVDPRILNEYDRPLKKAIGMIEISDISNANRLGLASVVIDIDIPFIYSVSIRQPHDGGNFEVSAYGQELNDFQGVNIIKLNRLDNGGFSPADEGVFYIPQDIREEFDNVTFDAPALPPGFYQLQFSSIFSHFFPQHIIEIH